MNIKLAEEQIRRILARHIEKNANAGFIRNRR